MPTPIGHLLGGAVCASAFRVSPRRQFFVALTILIVAELPDIDFLFGLLRGNANKYHHLFTHSLLFVLVVGALVAFVLGKAKIMQFSKSFVLFTVTGTSHLVLDLLALDTSEPYGMALLWPFSGAFYISPVTIFSDVHRKADAQSFFVSLFSWHNFQTVMIEVAILLPVLVVIYFIFITKRRN